MNKIRSYILESFEDLYDVKNDKEQDFDTVLRDFINRELIYTSDIEKFFNLSPATCINLWIEWKCGEISATDNTIASIAEDAYCCACYNYLYGQLEAIKNRLDTEEE